MSQKSRHFPKTFCAPSRQHFHLKVCFPGKSIIFRKVFFAFKLSSPINEEVIILDNFPDWKEIFEKSQILQYLKNTLKSLISTRLRAKRAYYFWRENSNETFLIDFQTTFKMRCILARICHTLK